LTAGEAPAAGGGASTRALLAVIISAILVSVMNQSLVNVVLPVIGSDFGVSPTLSGWVLTGYLLVFAVGIPLYGRVADLYSPRRTFALGLALLALGSLLSALAPSLLLLVLGRVVQAAGAAAIPALGFAVIASVLPPGERGGALGLTSSAVGVGAAVGPVVGGFVAGAAGWRALFLGTLVLSLLLLPFAWRVLPREALGDGVKRGFDVLGGSLLALTAAAALFGVTQGELSGFASAPALASFALAALSAILFARRIHTADEPFVSPGLFGNRAFLAGAALGFFAMFANVAALVMTPLLLSEVNGLSSAAIGLSLAPGAIALAVLSPFAGNLSDRLGPRPLILPGLALILAGLAFLSSFAAGAGAALVAVGMAIVATGFAAVNSPTANATAATLRPEETGVGLGIYQMFFFLGAGFAPAITGAFVAARSATSGGALNPLYGLQAPAYSDTFLLVCLAAVVAFATSLGLRSSTKKGAS